MLNLNSKQRAFLRGLAAKEPAIMQIGKDGVTENLIRTLSDALEARELVKLSLLENSGLDTAEAAAALEAGTGAVTVCRIGRKIVLYRESETNKRITL